MRQNEESGKYTLQNQLRTWSELKKRAAIMNGNGTVASGPPNPRDASPSIPTRKWGGCADGCNHAHINYPRRTRRQNTAELLGSKERRADKPDTNGSPVEKVTEKVIHLEVKTQDDAIGNSSAISSPREASGSSESEDPFSSDGETRLRKPTFLHVGRDFGGSHSGVGTPAEGLSDDSDYFDPRAQQVRQARSRARQASLKSAVEWVNESGMGSGAKADKLGDGDEELDRKAGPPVEGDARKQALQEAGVTVGPMTDMMIEKMKERDRKSLREIY